MASKRLSQGFTGSATRGLDSLEREIEYRLQLEPGFKADPFNPTKMDIFTDEFSPPGVAETNLPASATRKSDNNYQAKHDDFKNESVYRKELAAAGMVKDQKPLDDLDRAVQKREGAIKKPKDQFPGSKLKGKKMDNDKFHNEVEKRMSASTMYKGYKIFETKPFPDGSTGFQILSKNGRLCGKFYLSENDAKRRIDQEGTSNGQEF